MPALDIAYDDPRPRLLCALADPSAQVCVVAVFPAPAETTDTTVHRIQRRIGAIRRRQGLDTYPIYLGYIPEGEDAALRAMAETAIWSMALTIRGWNVQGFDPVALPPSFARDTKSR